MGRIEHFKYGRKGTTYLGGNGRCLESQESVQIAVRKRGGIGTYSGGSLTKRGSIAVGVSTDAAAQKKGKIAREKHGRSGFGTAFFHKAKKAFNFREEKLDRLRVSQTCTPQKNRKGSLAH